MKEPVDHILRPCLPWRERAVVTECGYDASKVKTLTRDEFFKRFKDLGERRTTVLTCVTCSDTARRWKTWDEDPRQAISREVEWENRFHPERGTVLKDELIAIAALIDLHKDEFAAIMAENVKRREWIERKAAHKPKPPPRTFGTL